MGVIFLSFAIMWFGYRIRRMPKPLA
jgi:hypothetical protein